MAIIFSIYMTLLAVLPCRDADDFANNTKTYTSISKSHPANEKAGNETCTPMCTCACCSMVRNIAPYQPVVSIHSQEIKQIFREATVPAVLEQTLSIWQPPQIA